MSNILVLFLITALIIGIYKTTANNEPSVKYTWLHLNQLYPSTRGLPNSILMIFDNPKIKRKINMGSTKKKTNKSVLNIFFIILFFHYTKTHIARQRPLYYGKRNSSNDILNSMAAVLYAMFSAA